jgi:hypothetical protein
VVVEEDDDLREEQLCQQLVHNAEASRPASLVDELRCDEGAG